MRPCVYALLQTCCCAGCRYDKHDEAKWQKQLITGSVQGMGYAHMRNVPQSVKKVDRVLRLVRSSILIFLSLSLSLQHGLGQWHSPLRQAL